MESFPIRVLNVVVSILLIYLLGYGAVKAVHFMYDRSTTKHAVVNVDVSEEYRQLQCLAENIYFEAAGEALPGKIAVAQVTMNRVKSGLFPDTICKVVHQTSQFSWVKDKPRALLMHHKGVNLQLWNTSMDVAKKVLFEREQLASVGDSLFYHANYVNPSWASKFQKVAVIGNHIFYRTTNGRI